jgi:Tol biopolymer transport system component
MRKKSIILTLLLIVLAATINAYSFGKNKVQVDRAEWSVIETIHFDIYYPKGSDDFGRAAALIAEECYYFLQDSFQKPLYEKIPIIFYESHREFQVTNIIYPLLTEGVGGFTESLRNRVVVPYDGSYKKLEEILIHELTHAYVNAMDRDYRSSRFFNIPSMTFPFWFSEGLPEYFAVGGEDNYNNMFVMDMVFNQYLYPLDRVGGYFAYRLGESFLTYIDQVYGKEAVMRLYFATKTSGSMDSASQRVFGMDFKDVQSRWRNYLFRKYSPLLQTHTIPYEVYNQRTDHQEDGSYLNFAPRFSPDGKSYLYFSNRQQRMSIWRAYSLDIFDEQLIVRGETTGKYEQFHFLRSSLSWFPDNRRFAFVAKTKAGDVLYIKDAFTGELTESHKMFEFDAIYEIDICKEGKRVVFSGQKNMYNNIYYKDLETGDIVQVTSDRYYDHQPRWSPDGSKIVFTSERSESGQRKYEHVFNRMTDQVYYFDLSEEKFYKVTDDPFSNSSAMWDSTGTKILFISEEENVANYHVIDLTNGERAQVTRMLTGVFSGDLNSTNKTLIFSGYYDNGWNIYFARNPLQDLEYYRYSLPQPVDLQDDFFEKFALYRYRYYGRDGFDEEKDNSDTHIVREERNLYRRRRETILDAKPDLINEPEIKPYRVRFYLDRLWGGAAYSSSYGTVGSLQLGLSDLMGDHTISIQLGISGKLKDSDFIFSYLHLPRRIDYGMGVFHLNDQTRYIGYNNDNEPEYYERREKEIGGMAIFRYPFNRFWRLDLENIVYHRSDLWDKWNSRIGQWEKYEKSTDMVYQPQLSLVHDNVLYGSTGPMTGWRGFLTASRSIARETNNYFTLFGDVRSYTLFAKRYSFAARFQSGFSSGQSPQNFRLDGYYGVRGLTEERRGYKKAVGTAELRFPFLDNLNMAFPLPMMLQQIRGSVYTDIGAVWDAHKDFKFREDGKLKDVVFGFGFGPRINLGFIVLKLDIAWSTDFVSTGSPNYYISINEEF